MKKYIVLFIIMSSVMLTSCQVNIGESTFYVHWLVIAIPVFILLLLVGLPLGRIKYYCPNCKKTFYTSWIKCVFSVHINNERALKCPHCKKISMCYPSNNQENKK